MAKRKKRPKNKAIRIWTKERKDPKTKQLEYGQKKKNTQHPFTSYTFLRS